MVTPINPQSSGSAAASLQTGVQSRHPDAAAAEIQYRRISDVLSGTDAVRSNARLYIPQTAEHVQYPETYEAMVARTPFTNYVACAVYAMEGLIFRKDLLVKIPSCFKPRLENINGAGDSVNTFSKKMCREIICYARGAVLVDVVPEDQ